MAAKRKAQERVQNYPDLFPELGGETVANAPFEGELFGEEIMGKLPPAFQGEPFGVGIEEPPLQDSLRTSKKPRRRLNGCKWYDYAGAGKTSRERRNASLWATLYPTPRRADRPGQKKEYP